MFRYFTFLFTILVVLFSSCNNMSSEELQYHIQIYQTLLKDNELLREKVKELKYDFYDQIDEPRQIRKNFYKSHFDFAYQKIGSICDSLNQVSAQLVKELYKKENVEATYFVNSIAFKNPHPDLLEKFKLDKILMESNSNFDLTIDSIKNKFLSDTLIIYNDYSKNYVEKDLDYIFRRDTTLMRTKKSNCLLALIDLEITKSELLQLENTILNYINNNSITIYCGYNEFNAIASINSEVFLPNQPIEIYAGVGSFSADSKPKISVNKKNAPLIDGMATYTSKAPKKAGVYSIPVIIEYTKPDGTTSKVHKDFFYTVVDTICK